jgi:hypothetical protein
VPPAPISGRAVPRGRTPGAIPALGLLLAVAAALWPVTRAGFIPFDDPAYVSRNEVVLGGLTPGGIRWAFTTFTAGNWHPLTWLSHQLDVSLFGPSPGAHHAVGLAIHLLAALLLFLLLTGLTGRRWPSLAASAIFSLHPLRVESVAWISERKDLLSLALGLAALLAHARHARRPRAGGLALTAGFLAAGLLAKPMLVPLPLILLLFDFWPLGRWGVPGGGRAGAVPVRALLLEKAPLLLLSALAAAVTLVAQRQGGSVVPLGARSLGERLGTALPGWWWYLGKSLAPLGLSPFYPARTGGGVAVPLVAGLALAGVTCLAWRLRRVLPHLLTAWVWHLVSLLPVIGLVQVGSQAVADRYSLLPHLGLALALAGAGATQVRGGWRIPVVLLPGALLVTLGLATHRQASLWRDGMTLFSHAVALDPENWMAWNNLGVSLAAAGRVEEGRRALSEAYRLNPAYRAQARFRSGQELERRGMSREAVEEYRAALGILPGYYPARERLRALGVGEAVRPPP